jgi:LDH2 family malate/lactate/ureidoglycolate dehydrogenase
MHGIEEAKSEGASEEAARLYHAEHLREFTERVLRVREVPAEDARVAADVLVTADLWGIDSHGVARLLAYYEMLERGLVNPRPRVSVTRELPATALLDGDNGLGLVVGPLANRLALEKAAAVGSGWVSVRGSNHFGIAGYYALQAVGREMIGWAMTNTPPLVSPLWGAERMLGTNPLAVAFPGGEGPPVVIDMSTSAVSFGVVEKALRLGEPVHEGVLIDREGLPTSLPQDFISGGALLPLGGDRESGGHKGYCMAAMIDLLCGVLSGANWGPFIPPFPHYLRQPERSVGKGLGHLFGAFRLDGFCDPEDFKLGVDEWRRVFRATRPAPGTEGVQIPGDPERAAEKTRRAEGIPLLPPVVEELREVAARAGVPFE